MHIMKYLTEWKDEWNVKNQIVKHYSMIYYLKYKIIKKICVNAYMVIYT